MSTSTRRLLPKIILAAAFVVMVAVRSPTPIQSNAPSTVPPTPAELQVILELEEWLLGPERGFRAVDASTVSDAIRERPRSFDLFRRYHEEDAWEDRILELPYGGLILSTARRHSLDAFLVAAVIEAESGFNPTAVSPMGALGLMQLMPDTAALYTQRDPLDPAVNVDTGARYLRSLLSRFDGDLELAIAAYNAGPGSVERYGAVPPYRETRAYVDKVLARYVDHHKAVWNDSSASGWLF